MNHKVTRRARKSHKKPHNDPKYTKLNRMSHKEIIKTAKSYNETQGAIIRHTYRNEHQRAKMNNSDLKQGKKSQN